MVPDERLQQLATLTQPLPCTTFVEFVDITGLIQGSSQGEGLGNKLKANISEVNAIIHVIRCFEDDRFIHLSGQLDPSFDKAIIDHELQL
jgi:ribosome-binding ATPase